MSAGESKGGDKLSETLKKFKANIAPGDKVAVFTLGRFHPVTLGHMELIGEVMETAEIIRTSIPVCKRMPSFSVDTFIWLSPTNVEEGWIHNPEISELKKRERDASSDREQRLVGREQKIRKTEINKTEPISTAIRVATLNGALIKFPIKPTILIDYQRTIDVELERAKKTESNFIKPIAIRESYGKLYSIRLLNWLRKSGGFNKIILLVGSDRVEDFKKYNNDLIKKLFDGGIILKSGGERGAAGKRDDSIDKLTDGVKKLSLAEKYPDRISGSIARNLITQFKRTVPVINIKAFLRQQGWKKEENTPEKRKQTIAQIKQIRNNHKPTLSPILDDTINQAIAELNDEGYDYKTQGNPFAESDLTQEDGGKPGNTMGGGKRKTRKRKRKRKRKRCSKKRLKKKMICHRGTKKKLRKLRKLTKKLKIRLTRCSKKRLKKWNVKKSRKKR